MFPSDVLLLYNKIITFLYYERIFYDIIYAYFYYIMKSISTNLEDNLSRSNYSL